MKTNEQTIANIKVAIKDTLVSLENTDNSSKSLFNEAYLYLKEVDVLNSGVTALKNVIDEECADYTSYYKGKLSNIIKYSTIAVNSKLSIDTKLLHWYNVEKALKLMEHLLEHYPTDVSKIKNLLNSLKGKSKDKWLERVEKNTYNEMYKAKLAELYKEYKLEDDEDAKGVKIEHIFATLSPEAKAKMLKKLQATLEA